MAVAAVAALGLSLAAPAHAGEETGAAATWLGGRLVDGLVVDPTRAEADLALSLEVGLTAYGVGDTALGDSVRDAVAPRFDELARTGEGADVVTRGNPTAQLLRLLQLAGDPADTTGEDLVDVLGRLVEQDTGRLTDQVLGDTATDDAEVTVAATSGSPDTTGQAFAAAALSAAGDPAADRALAFLLAQQCPGGGFRADFDATDVACSSAGETDADATARVVAQLAPLDLAPDALDHAATRLEALQRGDGSFAGADGAASATSTGLAARALASQTRVGPATRAANHVRGLQVRAPGVCSNDAAGAVAEDAAGFQELTGTATPDQADRADQAAVVASAAQEAVRTTALAAGGLASVSDPYRRMRGVAERGYVRARTVQPVTITGIAPRDTVCLDSGRVRSAGVADVDGTADFTVATGRITRSRTYGVVDTYGRTTRVTLRVLAATRFAVSAPRRARQGSTMTVTARGLASGERAVLAVAAGDRRVAYANRDGRVSFTRVPVLRDPGKRRYVVRGKFGRIRKGSDVVRVLRP